MGTYGSLRFPSQTMKTTFPCRPGETVLKPIGEIAQLIERTSLEDLFFFVIAVGKEMLVPYCPDAEIIIGKND